MALEAVGSNPIAHPIKETSFVYQDKRGFFLHFGRKTGNNKQNQASDRSIGCFGARFFVSSGRNAPKKLVYFLSFFAAIKKEQKCLGGGSRTEYSQKISVQVTISLRETVEKSGVLW